MAEQKKNTAHGDKAKQRGKQPGDEVNDIPKPESTAEYEGAEDREHGDNGDTEVKTETSSSSGQ